MEIALAPVIGLLAAVGVWLILTGDLLRLLFGVAVISNGVNLAIFAVGRLSWAEPPLTALGAAAPALDAANALPQALVLTAIVIGFGLTAFLLALLLRANAALGGLDGDAMRAAEAEGARE